MAMCGLNEARGMDVYMDIETLIIQITRNCTLYCEHCCRGDKQVINMSTTTIDNILKDVKCIKRLFLTGGEPFIAIEALERLTEVVKENKIQINQIGIIINGTILSSRHLKVLKELSQIATLDIRVSSDIFHMLELERLGLMEKRNSNIALLREYFTVLDYSQDDGCRLMNNRSIFTIGLYDKGRAKTLSEERLEEINQMIPNPYIVSENFYVTHVRTYVDGNTVHGTLYVDVNGNLVLQSAEEFEAEDEEAREAGININNMSIYDASRAFQEYYDRKHYEKLDRLLRR